MPTVAMGTADDSSDSDSDDDAPVRRETRGISVLAQPPDNNPTRAALQQLVSDGHQLMEALLFGTILLVPLCLTGARRKDKTTLPTSMAAQVQACR